MEQVRLLYEENSVYVVSAAVAALAIPTAFVLYRKIRRERTSTLANCPPNTVLLFQPPRGPYAPSMSNFPIKLETYLRIAKIPYMNDLSGKMSPKGKFPFMAYNGEIVSDSQFCMEYLNKKLGLDLNTHLSTEQRAVAKAFQILVDEHLYWTLVYFRWVYERHSKIIALAFPSLKFLVWYVQRKCKENLHGQGIGRHTVDEIKHIFLTDLRAIADFLGDKKFLMGDHISEVDCSVFGLLSQFVWHMSDDVTSGVIQEQFPSLYNYTIRMKEAFWSDWDDCITHGGTRPATK